MPSSFAEFDGEAELIERVEDRFELEPNGRTGGVRSLGGKEPALGLRGTLTERELEVKSAGMRGRWLRDGLEECEWALEAWERDDSRRPLCIIKGKGRSGGTCAEKLRTFLQNSCHCTRRRKGQS